MHEPLNGFRCVAGLTASKPCRALQTQISVAVVGVAVVGVAVVVAWGVQLTKAMEA